MIDRHREEIIYTAKRTSARRISAPSLEKILGRDQPVSAGPGDLTALCRALDYHLFINSDGDDDA
jgi:hypothetical protein